MAGRSKNLELEHESLVDGIKSSTSTSLFSVGFVVGLWIYVTQIEWNFALGVGTDVYLEEKYCKVRSGFSKK